MVARGTTTRPANLSRSGGLTLRPGRVDDLAPVLPTSWGVFFFFCCIHIPQLTRRRSKTTRGACPSRGSRPRTPQLTLPPRARPPSAHVSPLLLVSGGRPHSDSGTNASCSRPRARGPSLGEQAESPFRGVWALGVQPAASHSSDGSSRAAPPGSAATHRLEAGVADAPAPHSRHKRRITPRWLGIRRRRTAVLRSAISAPFVGASMQSSSVRAVPPGGSAFQRPPSMNRVQGSAFLGFGVVAVKRALRQIPARFDDVGPNPRVAAYPRRREPPLPPVEYGSGASAGSRARLAARTKPRSNDVHRPSRTGPEARGSYGPRNHRLQDGPMPTSEPPPLGRLRHPRLKPRDSCHVVRGGRFGSGRPGSPPARRTISPW